MTMMITMSMTHQTLPIGVSVERATPADTDAILTLLQDAARWLLSRGIEQWRPEQFERRRLLEHIARGDVFIALRAGTLAGTLALSWDDRVVWGVQPPVAGYVHGLAISRAEGGRGLGSALLDWAGR